MIELYVLGGLGLMFGLALAFLAKRFEVKKDPKIGKVRDLLPGINCGACGHAGCDAFAEAIVKDDEDFRKCSPGVSNHAKIAKVLGKDVECSDDRKVARLRCLGDIENCSERFDYKGVDKCSTAASLSGGPKSCSYGCLGLGDCVVVCPVGAITIDEKKLPVVDEEKCIACGKCVKECPKGLYDLVPINKKVYVRCVSEDKAKDVTKNCKVGCIACRLCEKACDFDAIHVIDNVARVDYDKCVNCGACVIKCPRNIIEDIRKLKGKKQSKTTAKPKHADEEDRKDKIELALRKDTGKDSNTKDNTESKDIKDSETENKNKD